MTDQPTTEPTTGSVAVIEDPAETMAGQEFLAHLAEDDTPVQPTDPNLNTLGCIISALALHVSPEWFSIALLSPPAEFGAQIEIRCSTVETAKAIVAALPWPDGTTTTTAIGNSSTHYVTRGVLWKHRVAVVGLEPLGGAR